MSRTHIPHATVVSILTEAGYRCAVPTCRNILAIDLHHMLEVSEGGGNDANNLLALCPTCHALFHRGVITRDSIYAWKSMLMTLNRAFDTEAIDQLLFLLRLKPKELLISGDGVLRFARLVAAELVTFKQSVRNGRLVSYEVTLTNRGRQIINAWLVGNSEQLAQALVPIDPSAISAGGERGQVLQRGSNGELIWDWVRAH